VSSSTPRPRWRRRLAIAVLVAGAAAAALLIAAHAWVSEAGAYVRTAADLSPRTAVIVPGARVYPSGEPSLPLADRLDCAVDLYRAGVVRRVLVSGDHGQAAYDEPNAMRRYLLARGVADADIFLDHAGFRTLDTMARAARVFGVRDAVVCTQAFHLERAVFLARRAGIDAVGVAADRHAYPSATFDLVRERLAVARAAVDAVLGVGPRLLGPEIPIGGDPAPSRDAASAVGAAHR